jgi:hypothetical protein
MNLENLNLVELNAKEVKELDGGWVVKILEGLAILASGAVIYHEIHCGKCNGTGWSTGRLSKGASGSW